MNDCRHDQDQAEGGGAGQTIREVKRRVGKTFGLTIAARAERCTDELLAIGDLDAIRQMIVGGWERELSHDFSKVRRAANRAMEHLVRIDRDWADGNGHVAQQLSFPVIAPGQPPVPLVNANHLLAVAALRSENGQLRGRKRNVAILERIVEATAPWPEVPIGVLLKEGFITMEQLFGPTKATAKRAASRRA